LILEKGGFMCKKNSFGKMPYEHIPDELPDPAKLATKNLPVGELVRRLKEKRGKPETGNKELRK